INHFLPTEALSIVPYLVFRRIYLAAQFGNCFTINCDDACFYEFVSFPSGANTRIGYVSVEPYEPVFFDLSRDIVFFGTSRCPLTPCLGGIVRLVAIGASPRFLGWPLSVAFVVIVAFVVRIGVLSPFARISGPSIVLPIFVT